MTADWEGSIWDPGQLRNFVTAAGCQPSADPRAHSGDVDAQGRRGLGGLPSPLWGGVGGGGGAMWHLACLIEPPPSPTLPHKGEGADPVRAEVVQQLQRNTSS